ncbi:MAG: divalent-cation tolerance protein CutA [Candidatus Thalassarchaeaceae archaeon]|jgi:periplasmic divalent cation tolerance protein|nr:divalent-cation tolerance protein CutA [Candidatus Thalassarchaeaceae archaeon]MEE2629868.1 divalent-cation tolerance protein CutA [Candidatus Thermoplasmatota archaeon]
MDGNVWVVQTTLPGDWPEPLVGQWAFELVESGLAACVQRNLVTSVYKWEDQIEESQEWRVQMKTSKSKVQELNCMVSKNHPYDTPQIIAWKADSSTDYTSWVEG